MNISRQAIFNNEMSVKDRRSPVYFHFDTKNPTKKKNEKYYEILLMDSTVRNEQKEVRLQC